MVLHRSKLYWVRLELYLAPWFQTTLQVAMFWQRVELQKESSLEKVCGEENRLEGVSYLQITIQVFAVRCFEEHARVVICMKRGIGYSTGRGPNKVHGERRVGGMVPHK